VRAASALRALVLFVVILLILSAQAASATAPSDDFNRADGSLGAGWSAISDGALSISSRKVVGTSATAGDIRTAETYTSDQSSQIQLTSTQLSGGQWAGPSVRTRNSGQDTYLGIYFWNNGSPELRLYKRNAGTWIQLGNSYASGALPAGTTLQLSAVGSTISFLQDGVTRITVTDTSISSGAPGIMTYGTATADNWTGGGASGSAPTYTVGGTVTGLSGTLVLQDNGGDDLTLGANGAFTFATSLKNGDAYTVTVKTNPNGQTCTVANGTGTIAGNVTKVAVTCSTPLAPGGSDNFNRANGGLGAGWTAISDGALSISSQALVGTNATAGDIRVAEGYGSDQSSQIQLTSTQLTGGQWIGPAVRMQSAGQNAYLGMYFWNNGAPQLRLYKRSAGTWTQLGSSYNSGRLGSGTTLQVLAVGTRISLLQNGVERVVATDASVTGGAPGIIAFGKAKADNWVGAGTTGNSGSTYSVGGTISGLSGTVVLRDNGGDDLTLSANGPFAFATKLAGGAAYNVTVKTNPSGQSCSVANGSGTIGLADVSNVAVSCTSNPTYSVGGSTSGLSGTVVLRNNGGDDLTLTANGSFSFATKLATGAAYNVTVKTNPSGQSCSVGNGSGTIAAANVTNVAVSCGTGNNGFSATYRSTDANGVDSYDVTSADNGPGTQTLRVLAPTHPAAYVPHSFLYLLPVQPGLATDYGDGMTTLEALDAENQYNLTIVEPSFGIDPWYADNPNDSNLRYDTFMTKDLVPWVTQNLSTTGHEQNWLLGFSKSGIGGQDLILNHPDVFTLAASWDFPADMSTYSAFGAAAQYGTEANFQANYRLTPIFLEAHKLPFINSNRIWIGGYQAFQTDMSDYDALLNSAGIPHTTETPTFMPHRWDSGWVQIALAALRQDSQNLTPSP
jgi:predicted transcriptional regulator